MRPARLALQRLTMLYTPLEHLFGRDASVVKESDIAVLGMRAAFMGSTPTKVREKKKSLCYVMLI